MKSTMSEQGVMDTLSVGEFIRNEVPDWDDDVVATARFKAFSGQRSDWESKFHFWRELIIKICRHFGIFIVHRSQVKNEWFNRGGLTPLCVNHVLFLMYTEGDIIRASDLVDPCHGMLSMLIRKVKNLMISPTTTPETLSEDSLVLAVILKEKADEVVKCLSECHWTPSCILTMNKFEGMCGGPEEASAILSYLSWCGKARSISINKKEKVQGVKVILSSVASCIPTNLDYDVLHLTSTQERLQQQLAVIDRRRQMTRISALASLKSGNKKVALRYARELKLGNENTEKCTLLLNRVEEVLNTILNAESTKKVAEAIQIGVKAMKENKINLEEVQLTLDELDESIESQKQVEQALESATLPSIEDEDVEEEFKKLELEVKGKDLEDMVTGTDSGEAVGRSSDILTDALSNLKLADNTAVRPSRIPDKNKDLRIPMEETI